MHKMWYVAIAVAMSFGIRTLLLLQAPDIGYDAYNTLQHIAHIKETGLPLTENLHAWGGTAIATAPLFYYLLAFLSLFFPEQLILLLVPNLLMSLIPVFVYLLATQITKHQGSIILAAFASAFVPYLYGPTLITANPITLAIPLLLLSYYYFIRLARTPKDQTGFLVSVIALTLTHPISVLLIPAMAGTLLFTKIQKPRYSKEMGEATIFSTFLIIWANVIIYTTQLREFGLGILRTGHDHALPSLGKIATLVGVLPLLAAVVAAYHYLTQERNLAMHALVPLVVSVIIALSLRLVGFDNGMLLLGILLVIIASGSIELLDQARRRSRFPIVHYIGYALIGILFVITAIVPAIALGIEGLAEAPREAEHDVLQTIAFSFEPGSTILWEQQHGYFLTSAGYSVPYDRNAYATSDHVRIQQDIEKIPQQRSMVRMISMLNAYTIDAWVLREGHGIDLAPRCFTKLHNTTYEVYRITCIVQ